jgi:hypothetical protein
MKKKPTAEQRKLRQLKACARKIVKALTKEA